MAKITVSDEVELMLSRLQSGSKEVCNKALYEGAKILADALRSEIEALPVDDSAHKDDEIRHGVRTIEKQGLIESMGVAMFRDEGGTITTHLGFDGYNGLRSKRWPGGQPNSMIARSVNSGTSFMQAIPFIDRTRRTHAKAAEAKMEEVIKDEIAKETR